MYSYITLEGEEDKKCKGVKKSVVKKSITHEDYKTCLFTKREAMRKQTILRSYEHQVYTEEVTKVALTGKDDKRCVMKNGVKTLAWGHYKLEE